MTRRSYETSCPGHSDCERRLYCQKRPNEASFERDAERIREYLDANLQISANGLAIFACFAAHLFEAVQLTAPIEHHWLFVGPVPHLYPSAASAPS